MKTAWPWSILNGKQHLSEIVPCSMTLGNWFHQKIYRQLTYGSSVQQTDDSWFASSSQDGTSEYCDKQSQHGTRKYPRNMYILWYIMMFQSISGCNTPTSSTSTIGGLTASISAINRIHKSEDVGDVDGDATRSILEALVTLPKTKQFAPENWWLEDQTRRGREVVCLSFRMASFHVLCSWLANLLPLTYPRNKALLGLINHWFPLIWSY